MIRKFECKKCHRQFEADDQHQVVCPHCLSDNVEPASSHFSIRIWKFVAAFVVLVLACSAIIPFRNCGGGESIIVPPFPEDSDTIDYPEPIPPTVRVSQPVYNDQGLYSVDVEAKNVNGNISFYYVMLSHFDKLVLQKNENGHFGNIHYCDEDSHSYDFAIMDSKTDTLLCVPIEQTGFVRQVTIESSKKMTAEQLQKLIDTQDESLNGVGESDYLAPDYQLKFTGLPSDIKTPESWRDLFDLIEFEQIRKATISQLTYDDKNRVKTITLKVTMP